MPSQFSDKAGKPPAGGNRRELFLRGGAAAAALTMFGRLQRAAAAPLEYGARLYRSIGVRQVLNARGTFTIITGSQTLPEVKRAMEDASLAYVQMDELMGGVSQRLAEVARGRVGHRERRLLRRGDQLHGGLHCRLQPRAHGAPPQPGGAEK